MSNAKDKLTGYTNYRGTAKPPRVEDKAALEGLNKVIQTRLKMAKKPAFMPPQGQSVSEITQAWNRMEDLEKGFEVKIHRFLLDGKPIRFVLCFGTHIISPVLQAANYRIVFNVI